jgi:hypothetical protein
MKIKVSELEGAQLDAWVAKANGLPVKSKPFDACRIEAGGVWLVYSPSISWSQGGPIIEREKIQLVPKANGENWAAGIDDSEWIQGGDTALIAAMRCFISSRFGNEVEE